MIFLAMGIMPEWTFYYFRDLGDVVTQRAYINSPFLVSWGLTGYLFFFVQSRCRAAGMPFMESLGRSSQVAVVSGVAFIPAPLDHLFILSEIPVPSYRYLIIVVSAAKLLSWCYIYSLILRYYLWGGVSVFTQMLSIFPSMYLSQDEEEVPLETPQTTQAKEKTSEEE